MGLWHSSLQLVFLGVPVSVGSHVGGFRPGLSVRTLPSPGRGLETVNRPEERRQRVLDLLVAGGPAGVGSERLCELCAEAIGVTGAGIMMMSGSGPQGSICTSDAVSTLIE